MQDTLGRHTGGGAVQKLVDEDNTPEGTRTVVVERCGRNRD